MTETKFVPPERDLVIQMPKPLMWKILVRPFKTPRRSDGGIEYTDETIEGQKWLTVVGQVVDMGEQAYQSPKLADSFNPGLESWVLYGKYAGQRILLSDGREFVIMNDDDVLAVVDDPKMYHRVG